MGMSGQPNYSAKQPELYSNASNRLKTGDNLVTTLVPRIYKKNLKADDWMGLPLIRHW
jgi:hypothetical protein